MAVHLQPPGAVIPVAQPGLPATLRFGRNDFDNTFICVRVTGASPDRLIKTRRANGVSPSQPMTTGQSSTGSAESMTAWGRKLTSLKVQSRSSRVAASSLEAAWI